MKKPGCVGRIVGLRDDLSMSGYQEAIKIVYRSEINQLGKIIFFESIPSFSGEEICHSFVGQIVCVVF